MKEANVFVRYRKKYKVTTNSKHSKPLFENILNREFKMMAPDRAYASDITYIHTQEGWLYLAIVIDLFSRKVVGWRMSSRMKAELVCDALRLCCVTPPHNLRLLQKTNNKSQAHLVNVMM